MGANLFTRRGAGEFPRAVLDTLRQPLDRESLTIHRAAGSATFRCRAQLVLAANPSPCATAAGDSACTCSALERRRYQASLSGPLLDRIGLPPMTWTAWLDGVAELETTAMVAGQVAAAQPGAVPRSSLALAERARRGRPVGARLPPRPTGRVDRR